jgi:Carboxypeptidase regulatory-like domain/TonB-dependent Receptor Plug Domain
MDPRSVCVLAWCGLAVLIPQSGRGQGGESAERDTSGRAYQFTGVVTDAAREPIPEAQVMVIGLTGSAHATTTDARGHFDLGLLRAGPLSFRVRRLGYEQRTISVYVGTDGQPTFSEVVLTAVPVELGEILVNAGARGRLGEFYERKQQRSTFARFLEQDEIRRLRPTSTSDLFRSVPGITIRAGPAGGNTIRIRNCQPMVWVDGQRVPGAELDEVAQPGDIAGIEFYPSSAGVPAQYTERTNRLCGLILVWTRIQ